MCRRRKEIPAMNKLFGLFLLALVCWAPSAADAASCFWVGGTGSINDTTKWSSSSGGAGSTCAATGGWPNSTSDNATFDASSGGGTITRNVAWTVSTLNIAAFASGTFGNTTDSAAVQLDTFTNNGSATRTFNMGTSTWTCGRTSTNCIWQISGATNLTLVASTSTLVFNANAGGVSPLCWLGSSVTYNNITFSPSSIPVASRRAYTCNTGAVSIANLTIGSPSFIELQGSANWTISGTLAFSGGTPSGSDVVWLFTNDFSSTHTFTLSGGAATCNWCAFSGITAATNGITANNTFDLGRNTNITITAPTSGGGGGGRIIGG